MPIDPLAPKDHFDTDHDTEESDVTWSCQPRTWNGVGWPFKFWWFAGYTGHSMQVPKC